jgi:hypothetical protein
MSRTIRYLTEGAFVLELEEEGHGVWVRIRRVRGREPMAELFVRKRELAGLRNRLEELKALPCLKRLKSSQS